MVFLRRVRVRLRLAGTGAPVASLAVAAGAELGNVIGVIGACCADGLIGHCFAWACD